MNIICLKSRVSEYISFVTVSTESVIKKKKIL